MATGTGDVANLYLKNTFFKGEAFCVDNNNKMLPNKYNSGIIIFGS